MTRPHTVITFSRFVSRIVVTTGLLMSPLVNALGVEPLSFRNDIMPILAENCFACHGFDKEGRQSGLRLDTEDGAKTKLDSGEHAIVEGAPDQSELYRRIATDDVDLLMPPADSGKKLSDEAKAKLKRWINEGARYEKHWAFEKPTPNPPPTSINATHPIDCFVHAKLAEAHLSPSLPADFATLVRRVSLDLTGLPPTPEEIDAFATASKLNRNIAYEELVERLLASKHYGERWGRWWLDQARYADSNGYSIDAPRQIWKYRDWVVNAMNSDMPFDQFTIEQLAGDLLPNASNSQKIATGFHRNTQINQEGGIDKEQFRIDSVFDRVATTGTVWLGLTVGCAQCHDHKFDPIEQKEYYRLFAFFNNQEEPTLKVYDDNLDIDALKEEFRDTERQLKVILDQHAEKFDAWEKSLSEDFKKTASATVQKVLKIAKAKRTIAQKVELFNVEFGSIESFRPLNERYEELNDILNNGVTTLVLQELEKPRVTTVFIKGDFTRPSDVVTPGTLSVLHPFTVESARLTRLDLAHWITSPNNPLTARVIVNRMWQQYFGRGLVETENDFGLQGSAPSHPELLDWLALKFVEYRWSLKSMHRLIVTSDTYRQSSLNRKDLREKDPNNYLLARQQRLRLDAEIVRDVSLVASGLFANKMGGPPVFPPIPEGVMSQGQSKREWKISKGDDRFRRGLYTFIYRATPPPSLSVFDAPEGFSTCTRRMRSNTPLQALTLLNDAAFYEFATGLEKIIKRDGLETAFRRCTSRSPTKEELAILKSLDTQNAARALLNLDETVTRE
jgi:Protein of unknown function (DUF1553)/Protein of unknown function (DUF1549)/Planctomycete cytochrome C